ncbi:MAG: type II toxin-antitoxin system RelE/ParE family toxin [Proteobacteria bacterium]|nr:type II toxin-antitoxin system RelE/ParE family toxin [Pseudomonadota bacterium]
MSFELAFVTDALKEWERLDRPIREKFKTKLAERLEAPRVPSAKLSGHKDRYKIKLRSAGYRLVYEVRDKQVVVIVVAVGRRDRNAVYKAAAARVIGSR